MRLNHPDYIKLVIKAYNEKRANNELSPLLAQSTPANIRRECANVYQERYEKKDEPALRAFFGPAEHGRRFLTVIQGFDVNKFRPLDNYLKGASKKGINDRNLELLAWLINFEHRPYAFGMEVILNEKYVKDTEENKTGQDRECTDFKEEQEEADKRIEHVKRSLSKEAEEVQVINNKEPEIFSLTNSSNSSLKNSLKKAVVIFLSLIILFAGICIIGFPKKFKDVVFGPSCMYWVVDHYEPVPCNEEPKGRLILPLDEEKIKNFKMITRTDTMTALSIGKAYYIKDSNTIKFYTEGGNYPEDVKRTLKVLSPHIFDTYLRKKASRGKDSLVEKNMEFINSR